MDLEEPQTKLPTVSEVVLRRRRRDKWSRVTGGFRRKSRNLLASRRRSKRPFVRRAEQFVKAKRSLISEQRRLRKLSLNDKETRPRSGVARLLVVVRIKGRGRVPPKIENLLGLLRLKNTGWTTFTLGNMVTHRILKMICPYVTYGYPNLKSVRELIHKRGAVLVNHKRRLIADNKMVEDVLGHLGIVCIDDLVHEVYTVGPNFKTVNNFLCSFLLEDPSGGWASKNKSFKSGGEYGFRKSAINDLLRRMI